MAPTDYTTADNNPPGSYTYSTTSWCTSNADNVVWLSNDSRSAARSNRQLERAARRWKSLT